MSNLLDKPIFVHVPKVAGGSIQRANIPLQLVGHNIRKKNYKYFKDIKKSTNQFSFTFVRNPWDRCVSAFRWLNSAGKSRHHDKKDAENFLLGDQNDFSGFIRHYKSNNVILKQLHFKPQYQWICDDYDNVLVDFIGRFENLQEDFNKLCDTIEVPREKLVHHKKSKTKHKHYTEYYDDETRQIVAEKYSKDIEYFGYKFD
jgi:hypothetical protein